MSGNLNEARRNINEMERGFCSSLFADFCCFSACFNGSGSSNLAKNGGENDGESLPATPGNDSTVSSRSWFGDSFSSSLKQTVSWKQSEPQTSQPSSQQQQQQPRSFPRNAESSSAVNPNYGEVYGGKVGGKSGRHLEEELSSNLAGVDHLLGGLRNMALDMDAEIGRQNRQLDGINRKAEGNSAAMGRAAVAMNKLIEQD